MDVLFGCIKGRRHPSFEGYHRDGAWAAIDGSWQELSMSDPAIAEATASTDGGQNNGACFATSNVDGGNNGGRRHSPPRSPPTGLASMKQRLSSSTSRSKHHRQAGSNSSSSNRNRGSSSSQSSLFPFRRQSSNSSFSPAGTSPLTSSASGTAPVTSSRPVCFVAPFNVDAALPLKSTLEDKAIEIRSAAGDSQFAVPGTLSPPTATISPVADHIDRKLSPRVKDPPEMTLTSADMMPEGMMTPPPTPATNNNFVIDKNAITVIKMSKFQYPLISSSPPTALKNGDAKLSPPLMSNGDGPVPTEERRNNSVLMLKTTTTTKTTKSEKPNNAPNLVVLSACGQPGSGIGVNRSSSSFQPPVEWLTSFPVASYTTLAQDQKMSAISSSPALLGGLNPNRNSTPLSNNLKNLGNGSSTDARVNGNVAPQQGSGNNLHTIVSRYAYMSKAWMEQQHREQQQQQQFILQQQQIQQHQMAKQVYFPQQQQQQQKQHYHPRSGVGFVKGLAPPKYLVNHFQDLSLTSADSLAMAGFGRLPVRSDEEAFAPFQFLAVLGKGNFGKVILCRDLRHANRRLCAIKVLKKKDIVKKREVVHTMTEVSVLRSFTHPFLVECYAAFQTATRLCLVLEYVVGGELYYQLFKKRRFSEEQTRFYVAEIVLAVGFLHANDFIYRDLKLENLLLDASGHIKITDFGLCKDLRAWKNEQMLAGSGGGPSSNSSSSSSSSSSSTANRRRNATHRKDMTFCGTPEYLAPEMLQVPGAFNGVSRVNGGSASCGLIYGKGVDWWALGIIVYEMLLGKLPFRTKTGDYDQLFHSICHREISLPDSLVGDVRRLLDGLLQKNPLLRLGHSNGNGRDYLDICESRWFADVDWNAVYEKKLSPPFVPRVDNEEDTQHFSKEFLELPTELTPTTSFVSGGAGGGVGRVGGRGGNAEDNYAASTPFIDDLFRGFSFTRN